MTKMNYREKIRKAISCPQFGDDHYGEWGALRLDQRKLIKRLLDELENNQLYCFKSEKDELQERIDKAIEKVKDIWFTLSGDKFYTKVVLKDTESGKELLEILGDEENE